MVEGGRSEVSFDGPEGGPQSTPGPAKLGLGKQLTISQMVQERNQHDAKPGQRQMLKPETVEGLIKHAEAVKAQQGQAEQEAGPNPEAQPQAASPSDSNDPQLEPAPSTDESLLFQGSANPYDDPKMKEAIEARCADLSFNSLLTNREVRQNVPIREGEFEVEFRSHTEGEEKYVRALLFSEGREGTSADLFYTRQADYLLALNLVSINGQNLKSHMTKEGLIDEELFKAKVKVIESYPAQLLGLLAINNAWFEERLRKLVTEGNIKNG